MRNNNDIEQYDAGDGASVAEKAKRAKVRETKRLNGLRALMGSPDGRLWVWEFLSNCGLFRCDFNGNSRDYFGLGMRNAGMPIFMDIQIHFMPEYQLMVKENANV